jgi:ABC-type polysaccharide/polyol phosphate transport system ATPase subunit
MSVIHFQGVSKSFSKHGGRMLLRDRVAHWLNGQEQERFHALKNISFDVEEGEGLAIVGRNGAGKSTLLGLVAGLSKPDEGHVSVHGKVAALLELGSGFHPDLTGAENVRVNASLIGLSRRRTAELFDEIVDFSGIGDFIHEPLRTYSSGMMMRLAFSVAINMDPEVLLVDEVLAVGDAAFQEKCFERVRRTRHEGKTLMCVSHSTAMVREMCDRAIWLDHGELMMTGRISEVVEAYEGFKSAAASM